MAKRGTLDHPKTKRLARSLGTIPGIALGLLETIWHYAGEFKKAGGLTVIDIEDALDAGGWLTLYSAEQVIEAMTSKERQCVWLDMLTDGTYYIHDWHEHSEDNINRALARAHEWFADGTVPNYSRLSGDERAQIDRFYGAHSAPNMRTRCALPCLALPCLAKPGKGSAEGKPQTVAPPLLSTSKEENHPVTQKIQEVDFWTEFVLAYPKRSGSLNRAAAEPIFRKHVKAGVDPALIVAGARKYRLWALATEKVGTEWVAQMTTWLNQKRWVEDFDIPTEPRGSPNGRRSEEPTLRDTRTIGQAT